MQKRGLPKLPLHYKATVKKQAFPERDEKKSSSIRVDGMGFIRLKFN
jgi:hypothetical protein